MKPPMLLVMSAAMDNAREGVIICDATLPDNPIIYVNKGFSKLTGYYHEEIIGKNCRFLQGIRTDKPTVSRIRTALKKQKSIQVEFINYTKKGKPFWNKLSITPIFNKANKLTHFIGVQDNITVEKEKDAIEQAHLKTQLIYEVTLQAQEKERKELGEELHDNINQMLATSKLYLKIASQDETKRLTMVDDSHELIDKAIHEIRKLSRKLITPVETILLNDLLEELAEDIRAAAPFNLVMDCCKFDKNQLTPVKKVMIFRIVQEQINNIIKHAKASNVSISVFIKKKFIELHIKDDGVGFDTSKPVDGIGLKNIQSRVEFQKGMMLVESACGKGTTLKISVPA